MSKISLSGHCVVILWFFLYLILSFYCHCSIIRIIWSLVCHDFCLLLSGNFPSRFVMLSLFDSFLLVIILLIWSLYCHYLDLIWFCALVGRYFILILSLPCHYEIMFLILALFGLLCCHYVIIFILWSLFDFLKFCLHYFAICFASCHQFCFCTFSVFVIILFLCTLFAIILPLVD